ncbi:glutathione S-transferase family protein [Dongia deserti]|uniref:glutathione S-transferase family protein n=1 Tax=Dongia deserti TaxID=2268030 RepID=UPI000E65640B|nr:glutathione S-transferase family protein [Dongia deserti]
MALTFYFGSGSPFAWKVWLVLEHKAIPHTATRLSFDNDDTKSPDFLKVNPRGRVPAIVDDGFALYESNAICEYLEEKYPQNPLLPKDVQARAIIRRLIAEADNYLYAAGSALMEQTLYVSPSERSPARIEEAKAKVRAELPFWANSLKGDFFADRLSLADFAIYPYMRIPVRVEERVPGQGIKREELPANIAAWMKRIEALPYFERTIPPHWKA